MLSYLYGAKKGLSIFGGLGLLLLHCVIFFAIFVLAAILATIGGGIRVLGVVIALCDFLLSGWAILSIVVRVTKGKSASISVHAPVHNDLRLPALDSASPATTARRDHDPSCSPVVPMVIKVSILKEVFFLTASLSMALAILALLLVVPKMDDYTRLVYLMGVIFFGGGALLFLVRSVRGSENLKLDDDGFTFMSRTHIVRCRWSDVTSFKVVEVGSTRTKVVGFSIHNSRVNAIQRINSTLTGAHDALPDIYPMSLEKLAELMNTHRNNALMKQPTRLGN